MYLAIIIIVLIAVVYFLNTRSSEDDNLQERQIDNTIDVTAVTKLNNDGEENPVKEDLEIVAAIMGALSIYIGVPASQLQIKSIKRVDGNNSSWRKAGMLE